MICSLFLRVWYKRNIVPRLYPANGQSQTGGDAIDGAGSDAPALHDLSYDEALFDAELRHFFKAEYRDAEPPPGVFSKVTRAINTDLNGESKAAARPANSIGTVLKELLAGPTFGRLVPGALALLVVVAVLGPDSARLLQGQTDLPHAGSFAEPTPVRDAVVPVDRIQSKLADSHTPLYQSDTEQALAFDPFEVITPGLRHINRTRSAEARRDVDPYWGNKTGPQ